MLCGVAVRLTSSSAKWMCAPPSGNTSAWEAHHEASPILHGQVTLGSCYDGGLPIEAAVLSLGSALVVCDAVRLHVVMHA